jgi:hypothetical protein
MPAVTSLLAGLWRDQGWSFRKVKHFFFTTKYADMFWQPPGIILNMCLGPLQGKSGRGGKLTPPSKSAELVQSQRGDDVRAVMPPLL